MIVQIIHLGFLMEVRLQFGEAKVLTPLPVPFTQPLENAFVGLAELQLTDYYPSDDDRCEAWAKLLNATILDPETQGPPPFDPNVIY
jgi:hypothetical protein